MQEDEIPGGDHGHHGNLSLKGKIPMVEPGIETGTSRLVVRDPDH
jgi:hypothetical protein